MVPSITIASEPARLHHIIAAGQFAPAGRPHVRDFPPVPGQASEWAPTAESSCAVRVITTLSLPDTMLAVAASLLAGFIGKHPIEEVKSLNAKTASQNRKQPAFLRPQSGAYD
jgi:hypothetical protein